jgi:hypothetical protein
MLNNWLRVLDTAEGSQVDQRVCHHLHPIVPLLNALKPQEEPLERVFPRKRPLDTHPQGMDGGVEEAFASALGRLVVSLNSHDEVLSAEYHKIRASQGTKVP